MSKDLKWYYFFQFSVSDGLRMTGCWCYLFAGVLFIQGYIAFSPIHERNIDEEWTQFNELLRDSSYRLPTTTRPSRYAVTLAPILDTVPANLANAQIFTFDGDVTITISATQANVNEIVLHCNDLTISELRVYAATAPNVNLASTSTFACEMPWSFLRIPLTTALDINLQYVIESTFRGNIQTGMRGFYRSWYIDGSGTRRWMATTQFQPGHARQAFPCYDEPSFKAEFDITIIRLPDFSPTLSNMPIMTQTTLTDGRVAETFYTTPLTSTYLIAFIVSHYTLAASSQDAQRPFHIYARNNAGSTASWSLEIGENLLTAMENFTGYPYYTMANNIIMQQAAIPDFSANAMENWGLLTYREAQILYDPLNSNHYYRERVANLISHEITHMWFGNLVTCAWWDNLWLNEAFARFYQYYLTQMVAPDMRYDTRFIVEQVHMSLLADSVDSAHALTDPSVGDPTSVSAHFSTITYGKGASVLRMTQHLLGEETYRKALQNYLANNQFSTAEPQDLFNELNNAAAEDNALTAYNGITVDEYMKTWTEQAGHPIVTVAVDHTTGQITVTQERWNIDSGVSSIRSSWYIPITWTRAGDIDFENTKPTQIITGTTTVIDRGTTGREWVIFNKQQTGFYRVNYDSVTWALITQALRNPTSRIQIHEYNRAQIVDDVFIMAQAGVMSYSTALNILSFLEFEDQYAPWLAAITGFEYARRRLAHNSESLQKLEAHIISLSAAVTRRLGFAEVEGESYMDGLFRMYLNSFLCDVGHQECVTAGRTAFVNWRSSDTSVNRIPANMRPWAYCTGLRYGDADDFNFLWNRYLIEDLASEMVVILQAAGCTRDEASLQIFLNAITAGDNDFTIRAQDITTTLNSAITSNEVNTMIAFNWLRSNVERTIQALGSVSTLLNIIIPRLLTEEQISEVSLWLDANQAVVGADSYNAGVSAIATTRANIQWYNQRITEFETYFETGYIEEIFVDEDTTTTTTTTTTTESPVTTDVPGDSATAVTLNFILLTITLALIM